MTGAGSAQHGAREASKRQAAMRAPRAAQSFALFLASLWRFQPGAEAIIKELDTDLFEREQETGCDARSFQESFFLQPISHDLLNKMRHRTPVVFCCLFERRPNILIEANA
jgi:hypothetical protein